MLLIVQVGDAGALPEHFKDGDVKEVRPDDEQVNIGGDEKKLDCIIKVDNPAGVSASGGSQFDKYKALYQRGKFRAGPSPDATEKLAHREHWIDWRALLTAAQIADVEDTTIEVEPIEGKYSTADVFAKITKEEGLPSLLQYQQQQLTAMQQELALLREAVETLTCPDPPMATVDKNIGNSRDYATISSWESQLDNGAVYSLNDDAVGHVFDDKVYTNEVTFDGGGTIGLTSMTLTADSGERHDGTEGSGSRTVVSSVSSGVVYWLDDQTSVTRNIEWMEIDANGLNERFLVWQQSPGNVDHCLLHGINRTSNSSSPCALYMNNTSGVTMRAIRNIIYDETYSGSNVNAVCGISWTGNGNTIYVLNNSVSGVTNNTSSGGNCFGIHATTSSGTKELKNNVVVLTGGSTTGTKDDFSITAATSNNNASEDSTAHGTSAQTGLTPGDEFVNTSNEFLVKDASSTIADNGADLGTTPAGVEISIRGRDVDAEGDTWSIGADQFVDSGGGAAASAMVLMMPNFAPVV